MKQNQDVKKIISLYADISEYEALSLLMHEKKPQHKRYPFDFLGFDDVSVCGDKITIKVDQRLKTYLVGKNGISKSSFRKSTKITNAEKIRIEEDIRQEIFEKGVDISSPEGQKLERQLMFKHGLYVDDNRLLFSPVIMTVFFEEEETSLFFPIVLIDISKHKEEIRNHDYKEPLYLDIDTGCDAPYYNDFAINSFFSDKFKEMDASLSYIANKEEEDKERLYSKIYESLSNSLKKDDGYQVSFPEFKKSKPFALFFNESRSWDQKKFFKLSASREFNSLLKNYLLNNNTVPKEQQEEYFGHMAKNYSLSRGQSILLGQNQAEEELMVSFGPPGTGKTSLIFSIIANNITKRAINIVKGGKDQSNAMLITSVTNKAVDNVSETLVDTFKDYMCFIGGTYAKNLNSQAKVREEIDRLENHDFDSSLFAEAEQALLDTLAEIGKHKHKYNSIRSFLINEVGVDDIRLLKIDDIKVETPETVKYMKEFLSEINAIAKKLNHKLYLKKDLQEWLDFSESTEGVEFFREIKDFSGKNFLSQTLFFNKLKKDLSEKTGIPIGGYTLQDLIGIAEMVGTIYVNCDESNGYLKRLKNHNVAVKIAKEKNLSAILECDNFAEYSRKYLSDIHYRLFLESKKFLEMHALKNKDDLIDALEYLSTGEFYSVRNKERLLRALTKYYPVFSSTLASADFVLRGLKGEVFDLVIVDESNMIKPQDLIGVFSRSKRALILGDPKQFQPIVKVHSLLREYLRKKIDDDEFFFQYSPTEVSAYHRAAGEKTGGYEAVGRGVLLNEHRRCQPDIADLFCKVADYQDLEIKTPGKDPVIFKRHLAAFNVVNREKRQRLSNREEADAIAKILDLLEKNGIDISKDVFIITPYVKQETLLLNKFSKRFGEGAHKRIGTIHKFEGSESKVVIFSSVVSSEDETLNFINKDPSLVNVAISRAMDLFILVGDLERLSGAAKGNFIGMAVKSMKGDVYSLDELDFLN